MAKLLALETAKRIRNVQLNSNYIISDLEFLGWGRCIKCNEKCVGLDTLTVFLRINRDTPVTPCSESSSKIFSSVMSYRSL